MAYEKRISGISKDERTLLVSRLVKELPVLRTKLGISQDELASMIGVSRQTYCAIETSHRKMPWNTYLSLVLIFDYNEQTHDFVRKEGIFPQKIIRDAEVCKQESIISQFISAQTTDLISCLDEQAIHAIETVIMVEYARCKNISGDAVVRAFDGKRLSATLEQDAALRNALSGIKADITK